MSFLSRINEVSKRSIFHVDVESIQKEREKSENQVLSLVFMPNPVTGRPDSTISLMLSDKERPQVREFIQQNLFTKMPQNGFDNVEDSEVFVDDWHNQIGEERDAFKARLFEFVKSLRSKKEDK